jgi:hypothetical protein
VGKSKPDKVIVHRLDLQPSTKQFLEDAMLINAASKIPMAVGTAVGGIAAGLGSLLGAGFAAFIAAKAAGEIKDVLDETVIPEVKKQIGGDVLEERLDDYQYVVAFIGTLNWSTPWFGSGVTYGVWNLWETWYATPRTQEIAAKSEYGDKDANIVVRVWKFLSHFWHDRTADATAFIEGTGQWANQGPVTPQEAWDLWYTVEEVLNDSVYQKTKGQPVAYTLKWAAENLTIGGRIAKLFGYNITDL